MKKSLEHLPKDRQGELQKISALITQLAQPEKVILFGSYATGRWVADKYVSGHITYEYLSDYDILAVTKKGEKREEHHLQEMLETKCQQLTAVPVNIIIHNIEYVNKRISEGQYFFADIKKEGILLYDAGNIALTEQKELSPKEKQEIAQKDFDNFFSSAEDLLARAIVYNKKKPISLKNAVFLLHQTAEKTYNAIILVFTGYKSKTHNLSKLIKMSREFAPDLATVFPNDTPEEIHLFTLLKKAYVDARYNDNYRISEMELATLIKRLQKLQMIVEAACKDKIASLK